MISKEHVGNESFNYKSQLFTQKSTKLDAEDYSTDVEEKSNCK